VTIEHHVIVYLEDEDSYGYLVSEGVYASRIRFTKLGIEHDVMVLNEEFEVIEDIRIEIEEELL
jgi:hypothetical protein